MTELPDTTVFAIIWGTLICAALAAVWARPQAVIRARALVLLVVAAISVLATWALIDFSGPAFRMSLDPSEEPMLDADADYRRVYQDAIDAFGDDDLYVIVMETDGVFSYEHLSALRRVSDQIRRLPAVRSAANITEATDFRFVPIADLVAIGDFMEDIPESRPELHRLRGKALDHPIYPKTLISKDGRTAAINVAFKTISDGEFVEAGIDDSVRAILADATSETRRFYVTGRQHVKTLTHRMLVDDLSRLIPLAVVVGAAIAWLVTGSLRSAVISVGASLVATLWAFGALALLGRSLNLITVILGPTLICVGSVYGVHVLARFDEAATRCASAAEAAVECLRYVTTPVLIAGVSTCVGFGALLLSDKPAIEELGLFCALGVASVTLISLSAVPALLAVLPVTRRSASTAPRAAERLVTGFLERAVSAATTHTSTTLTVWGLIAMAAVVAIPRTVVDTDYLTFFDEQSEVRRDFAAVSRLLVGAVPIYVVLDGGKEGVFRSPDHMVALQELQERLDAIPEVSATMSIVDFLLPLNRVLERDSRRAERIPDRRGEVTELLFLLPKAKVRRYINSNHSATNIVVRTGVSGSDQVLALEQRIREAIAEQHLPDEITATITGNAIVVNHGADDVAADQFTTVGVATLAILIVVSLVFRSLRLGALSMVPNVVPVLCFFGMLGAGVATLSLPTSLIGCIALGIAIDDTAHFLNGYRRRRQDGADHLEAAAGCIRTLGRPIVTTSLMLIGGFLVLTVSNFATLREFGYLTAATMFVCLCADLLLLPALLVKVRA